MTTVRLRSNANFRSACSGLLLVILLGIAAAAAAAPVAEVTHVSGALMARKPDGTSRILAPRSKIEPGDLLATAQDTYARIRFTDGSEVTLRSNTQFRVDAFNYEEKSPEEDSALFSLIKGGLRTITGLIGKRTPRVYEMRTVTATIGIRGTHYGLLLCQGDCATVRDNNGKIPADGLHLDVAEGAISVTNQSGQVIFTAGQLGFVESSSSQPTVVPPEQGVTRNVPSFTSENPPGQAPACVVQ
jgi:hypothetical protein